MSYKTIFALLPSSLKRVPTRWVALSKSKCNPLPPHVLFEFNAGKNKYFVWQSGIYVLLLRSHFTSFKPHFAYRENFTRNIHQIKIVMEQFNKMTDQDLVERYQKGCNEAFDCLLERHKDRLYNYIFFTVRNADLADDLFQETFVKVILTLRQGRYTESGRFFSWLTRIAHNLVIDHYRQENGVNMVNCDEVERKLSTSADMADASQEATLINHQTLCDVRSLMDHLPEPQREVVFMRFYQDLSFKEIAEITGVSINTSLGRMRYALINMRRMAQEHGISLELL